MHKEQSYLYLPTQGSLQVIFTLPLFTVPISPFTQVKALSDTVSILVQSLPSIIFPPKTTQTRHTVPLPATARASSKFAGASLPLSKNGRCEPVSTTGTGGFSVMTDKAAAVYAIVSVPCVITIPSYFPMLSLTVSAMRFWSDIVISLLSMFISVIGTISYFSQTCGISASIFPACSSLDCGASPH